MRFPILCHLSDRYTLKCVDARIRLATEADLASWTRWMYRPGDEDREWDWWAIYVESTESLGRYECYAISTMGVLQGLMLLDLRPRRLKSGSAIVVDYLATNPANRIPGRGLKHVGAALLAVAIARAFELGVQGCLRLESLPGAETFYRSLGFSRQRRKSKDGNSVFVMPSQTAKELLDEIQRKEIVRL